jgi:hypothetical protein
LPKDRQGEGNQKPENREDDKDFDQTEAPLAPCPLSPQTRKEKVGPQTPARSVFPRASTHGSKRPFETANAAHELRSHLKTLTDLSTKGMKKNMALDGEHRQSELNHTGERSLFLITSACIFCQKKIKTFLKYPQGPVSLGFRFI